MAFRRKAVVDSLEGNTLVHPLTTPVLVVNRENTKCRSCWKSLGVEGLSKHREMPEAVVSIGSVPGVDVVEDGEWKKLSGDWLRLTKNEYHKGWVGQHASDQHQAASYRGAGSGWVWQICLPEGRNPAAGAGTAPGRYLGGVSG